MCGAGVRIIHDVLILDTMLALIVELLMSQKRFRGHFLLIRVFIYQNVCYHE